MDFRPWANLVASQLSWDFPPLGTPPKHPRALLVVPKGESCYAVTVAVANVLHPSLYLNPVGGTATLGVLGSNSPLLPVCRRGDNLISVRLDLVLVWVDGDLNGSPVDPWWRASVWPRVVEGGRLVSFGDARSFLFPSGEEDS